MSTTIEIDTDAIIADMPEESRRFGISGAAGYWHQQHRFALEKIAKLEKEIARMQKEPLWELCDIAGAIGQAVAEASSFIPVRGAQEHYLKLPKEVEVDVEGPTFHVEGQKGMRCVETDVRITRICVETVT